jgi:hypothetical protein
MLERSGCLFSLHRGFGKWFGIGVAAVLVAACATETTPAESVTAPAGIAAPAAKRPVDPALLAEEARAMLAQAETDVQRARSQRVLWSGAWEALLEARAANEQRDPARTIRWAGRASDLAQLGLAQAAYPAVR